MAASRKLERPRALNDELLLRRTHGLLARSRETSLEEVDSRKFWPHTRDAICWLFSPYL